MSVVGHEEWVVDDVSCRGHHEVRPVVQGRGQADEGPDPGRGGVRDRLVPGQRPASADQRGAEPAAGLDARSPRGHASSGRSKFSYDALKVLQRVWAASGGQCGKYLAASMRTQLDGLERHGELVDGVGRYSMAVRAELLAMSAASIDRYLRPAKATDQIRGVSTTKPSPLLRSSIKIRKAGDEVEAEPGFFEGDTVAHCGPTLKGEFARTLNLTCVHTGWVFTRTMRNNAHVHVLAALQAGVQEIPFTITGLDFDNGTEFLNKAVINWAGERDIYFTRSRPYKKNDQATIESKNNHLVRKYGFYYRYDTERGTPRAEPALEARQRPVQLPHPDQETGRLGPGQGRPPQASVRQATNAAGPPPRRRGARPRPRNAN